MKQCESRQSSSLNCDAESISLNIDKFMKEYKNSTLTPPISLKDLMIPVKPMFMVIKITGDSLKEFYTVCPGCKYN
jgi:hypothetical protein